MASDAVQPRIVCETEDLAEHCVLRVNNLCEVENEMNVNWLEKGLVFNACTHQGVHLLRLKVMCRLHGGLLCLEFLQGGSWNKVASPQHCEIS